jgi:hypothetical protein
MLTPISDCKFQISDLRLKLQGISVLDGLGKSEEPKNVMLNLIQHLPKSRTSETLKQVQGDKSKIFTSPSIFPICNLQFEI